MENNYNNQTNINNENKIWEFNLKNAFQGINKNYYVAKFPLNDTINFNNWEKPIKLLYKEEKKKKIELPNVNPTFQKKQKRKVIEQYLEVIFLTIIYFIKIIIRKKEKWNWLIQIIIIKFKELGF